LAYEHSVTIKLQKSDFLNVYNSTLKLCQSNQELNCSVLSASFSTDRYKDTSIKVRIEHDKVDTIINHAKANGELVDQSTEIDDLTKSFVDTEKRLEMLTAYREKLLDIQVQAANDVDSLIKIASELTTTQKQIEQTKNSKYAIDQRLERDFLTISFTKDLSLSFWDSIGTSISEIPESFSEGLSEIIGEIFYLLPWLLVIIFLFVLFRWLWHKTAAKPK
jgi:hypothetical protein